MIGYLKDFTPSGWMQPTDTNESKKEIMHLTSLPCFLKKVCIYKKNKYKKN